MISNVGALSGDRALQDWMAPAVLVTPRGPADCVGVDMAQTSRSGLRSRQIAASGFWSLAVAAYGHQSAHQVQRLRTIEARAALSALGPVVYAVRTNDGLIKIGHTTDLLRRLGAYRISLKSLQRLLMVKRGTVDDEQVLHRHFAVYAERGREYYRPAPEIIDYINAVRRQMGVGAVSLTDQ